MKLDDLSAEDLTAIDAVCLEFEKSFGTDQPMGIEGAVKVFLDQGSGKPQREHIELLRQELIAIEAELLQKRHAESLRLRSAPTPFQSKTTAIEQTSPFSRDLQFTRSAELSAEPGTLHPLEESEVLSDRSIGPYCLGRVLARGGMGVVYRAMDTRLDRPVAIKMMGFPNLAPTDPKRIELVERFEREAKAVAALSHPNIVELFDVGVAGSVPYAVMEFLSGLTLADQLVAGPMSPEQTCQIGMQIAGALATAHAAGVIHRDLKPQNVMLVDNRNGGKEAGARIKLVDFGLSRVGDSAWSGGKENASPTRSGMILGTPGYMAPEQARGESATSAADMFGFGCVLYEVFYGRQAIPGETPADRLAGTLRGEVRFEPAECEKSKLLCELISECLRKDPKDRPAATEVYARLHQFEKNGAGGSDSVRLRGETDDGLGTDNWPRRHLLTTVAGGLMGGMLGGWTLSDSGGSLGPIDSIAVLTFRDVHSDGRKVGHDGLPLADRKITEGDTLASALVNELSAVEGLAVLPYRPQTADTPDEYRKLGEELGVDAFLAGTFENQTLGQRRFWVFNWQLISARDGSLLFGEQFVTEQAADNQGDPLLVRSAVASNVAKEIGRALVTTGQKSVPPDAAAYGCMMKGQAYADPDSTKGLKRALMCFDKAHAEDPRLSEPLAAIAVASLNLAARSDRNESLAHLEKATSSMKAALALDPRCVDARLAKAMIEWQTLYHYEDAGQVFAELSREHEYDWQIQHQRGLFLTAMGRRSEAIDAMHIASKMNPMSMLIKTDRCRVDWFFGDQTRAIGNAIRYRDSTAGNGPARELAVGLLIDIYEDQRDYRQAALQQGVLAAPSNADDYYKTRQASLRKYPYGPFGTSLNRAIFELRKSDSFDEGMLGVLDESGATMLPLLLAQHPVFSDLRRTEAAARFLPSSGRSNV